MIGILTTRSKKDNDLFIKKYKNGSKKVTVYSCPLISYVPKRRKKIDPNYTDLVVTSQNAAKILVNLINFPCSVWVVGNRSKSILSKNSHVQKINYYETVKDLANNLPSDTSNFIYYSASIVTMILPMKRVVLYNTKYASSFPNNVINAIRENKIYMIVLYSVNTAKIFIKLLKEYKLLEAIQKDSIFISPNQTTELYLKKYFKSTRYSPEMEEDIKKNEEMD